jgi:hypothetical protein
MKKIVAIGRKYPEFHTVFQKIDLRHDWPRPTEEIVPDIDYDLLRKIEIESSETAEFEVE